MRFNKKVLTSLILGICMTATIASRGYCMDPISPNGYKFIIATVSYFLHFGPYNVSVPVPSRQYNFDDLLARCNDAKPYFSFGNSGPVGEMFASLPAQPPDSYGMAAAGNTRSSISYISFPWDGLPLVKGDIIIMRGNDWIGKFFSGWSTFTHTAMVWDKQKRETLESAVDGVMRYQISNNWGDRIVTFAVKRPKYLSQAQMASAADSAMNSYRGTPYFPKMFVDSISPDDWLRRWMDKNDMSSMYCSKLVWRTYKNISVDLDTNYTRSVRYGDAGGNWIGVSPDDIYRSPYLGYDMYCQGYENLGRRFDSIF